MLNPNIYGELHPTDNIDNAGLTPAEKRLSCIEINIDDLSGEDKFSNSVLSRKISENVDKLMLSDDHHNLKLQKADSRNSLESSIGQ